MNKEKSFTQRRKFIISIPSQFSTTGSRQSCMKRMNGFVREANWLPIGQPYTAIWNTAAKYKNSFQSGHITCQFWNKPRNHSGFWIHLLPNGLYRLALVIHTRHCVTLD